MAKQDKPHRKKADAPCDDPRCRHELLQEVMHGTVPADQYVERMLDHLERTA